MRWIIKSKAMGLSTPVARWLFSLVATAALIAIDTGAARSAPPSAWQPLCRGLAEYAGLVTDYRNQGKSLHDTVDETFAQIGVTTDRAVAAEIAQQVYATPAWGRMQEISVIFAKCITPLPRQSQPGRRLASQVTDLRAIPLQLSSNHIEHFAVDGRDGNITLAWFDDGRERGHDLFQVTMPSKGGGAVWHRVGLFPETPISDGLITDNPNRGYNTLRSLRFARGKVDREDAVLLLIVSRSEDDGSVATDAVYEVYRLTEVEGRDGFERIERRSLPTRYCNADMALSVASGLPLRSSYRGPHDAAGEFTKDGCPPVQPSGVRISTRD